MNQAEETHHADGPVVTAPPTTVPMEEPEAWQRLWLATQKESWSTLAIVPADEAVSTFEVASFLALSGRTLDEWVSVADVRHVSPRGAARALELIDIHVGLGKRILLSMRSPARNLATIQLARGADRVILCATLGKTSMPALAETVAQIGREHFLGSMLIRPRSSASASVQPA